MTGIFTPDREATLPLIILDVEGYEHRVVAALDTGFNGDLTLSRTMILRLGLPYHSRGVARLGDGSHSIFRKYEGTILWDDAEVELLVVEAETDPLIGVGLLYGSRVCIDMRDGGEVTIESQA